MTEDLRHEPHQPAARPLSLEQEDLRAVSNTVMLIHGLLVILILLSAAFGIDADEDAVEETAVYVGVGIYVAIVLLSRFVIARRRDSHAKIVSETLAMMAVITWSLMQTGSAYSPLFNTYLLPVLVSALTLGRLWTLAVVVLITLLSVAVVSDFSADEIIRLDFAVTLSIQLAPLYLVAYVVSHFSADIRFRIYKEKLRSETDALTGLYNVRGFSIAANRLLGQAQRHRRPVSMLLIGCDDLQGIIDQHGQSIGDAVLRRLTETILVALRHADVAARYSEDEFVLLLGETPVKDALAVAARISASAQADVANVDGVPIGATVCIGVASSPEDGRGLDMLIAQTERALRTGRHQGGNRVVRLDPTAA